MPPVAEVIHMELVNRSPDRHVPGRTPSTIDRFADEVSAAEGVTLTDLDPGTTLLVTTRNSEYRIVVVNGTTVVVRGGRLFDAPTGCVLGGSSFGGALIKLGWIGVGLCMEIHCAAGHFRTSPVHAIAVERDPTADSLH